MYERTYRSTALKQDKLPKEKKPFPWKRLAYAIGALVVIAGLIYVIRLPQFQVQKVEVEGTNVASPDDVSQFVLNRLSGYRLYVFPRGSIFLLSPHKIEKAVQGAFPRFQDVSVTRTGLRTLSIAVHEYDGVYVWCAVDIDAERCYFMDEKGTVFAQAPYFSGSAYPKVYIGEEQQVPFKPISDTELTYMQALLAQLPDVDIAPASFHFLPEDVLEVHFLHNADDAKLIFDTTKSVDDSLEVLFSGFRTPAFADSYKSSGHVLHYIDLRFSNKMVYKFD